MVKTTDNQEEVFYLVDEFDRELGRIRRKDAHQDRTKIHRAVVIFVYNSKGELFMQQRSLTKDIAPGLWTISAGGHLSYGDTYEEGAKRELYEELGVVSPLTFIHKVLVYSDVETEINSVYKTFYDGPFTLHSDEINAGRFFPLTQIEDKIRKGSWKLSRWSLIHLTSVCGILPERADLNQFSKRLPQ